MPKFREDIEMFECNFCDRKYSQIGWAHLHEERKHNAPVHNLPQRGPTVTLVQPEEAVQKEPEKTEGIERCNICMEFVPEGKQVILVNEPDDYVFTFCSIPCLRSRLSLILANKRRGRRRE